MHLFSSRYLLLILEKILGQNLERTYTKQKLGASQSNNLLQMPDILVAQPESITNNGNIKSQMIVKTYDTTQNATVSMVSVRTNSYGVQPLISIGVDEILPGKEDVVIWVRVVRMWKAPGFLNPFETNSLKMVLIDAKGGQIHAYVRKHLLQMLGSICSKIDEGQVYQINVIGVMTGISAEREYIRDDKITKMVIIELTDHTGKCECALFGDYVDEVKRKMEKSYADKASIQNVNNTTRILINPDISEVETFKNSIAVHGIETDTTVPLIGEAGKSSLE
ncbi:hypothetical protein P8452_00961 [Trifolium repens]|nr:hypothetical protein P8452_00961 [Trifolium repens]